MNISNKFACVLSKLVLLYTFRFSLIVATLFNVFSMTLSHMALSSVVSRRLALKQVHPAVLILFPSPKRGGGCVGKKKETRGLWIEEEERLKQEVLLLELYSF